MRNVLKTAMLLTFLILVVIFCGYALGGRRGMRGAFFFASLMSFGIYGFSDRSVLAMHRAQPLSESEAPEVFEIVRELSEIAGIPAPRLYMLPSASANCFSTGRSPKHAAIAVTHGIVGLLNREELAGVFGHELSHILDHDSLLSSIVAVLAGALSAFASIFRGSFAWGGERDDRDRDNPLLLLLFVCIMPLVGILIQLMMARSREYRADKRAARLCGNPLYLASALRKIAAASAKFPLRDATPATAHLFIMNPLSGKGWTAFFNTHPSVEARADRLEGTVP